MRLLVERIIKRFEGFLDLVKYAFIFVFLLPFLCNHAFEYLSGTDTYITYDNIVPIELVSGNKVGESAVMRSNSTYHRWIDAQWSDNMICNWVERVSQPWSKYIWPDSSQQDWSFSAYVFQEEDITCRVCWDFKGITPKWYKKTLSYCSPLFDIERG